MTTTTQTAISAKILEVANILAAERGTQINQGSCIKDALNAVLGAGTFESLASNLHDELNA